MQSYATMPSSVILGVFPTLQAAQDHAEALAKDSGDELDRDDIDKDYDPDNLADAFFIDGVYHEILTTQLHNMNQRKYHDI